MAHNLFQVDGNRDIDKIYCAARYFNSQAPDQLSDDVMYIRDQDVYVKDGRGAWAIMERVVITDAIGHVAPQYS